MQPNELVWLWVCPDVTVEVDVVPRPQVVGVQGAAQAQAHRGRIWGRDSFKKVLYVKKKKIGKTPKKD